MSNYFSKPDSLVDAVKEIYAKDPGGEIVSEDTERNAAYKMIKVKTPDGRTVMRKQRAEIQNEETDLEDIEEKRKLDPVDPKELKGTHAEREDGDIDNDGDEDESDEYLHKRRKAVKKAMKKDDDDGDDEEMKESVLSDEEIAMIEAKLAEFDLDEARGRPRKDGSQGSEPEPDDHFHVQVKKVADYDKPGTVKHKDGSTSQLHPQHAKAIDSALQKMKPNDREKVVNHMHANQNNFKQVVSKVS